MEMLKTITAVKARQNLGLIMNEVALKEDDYIIERSGKPLVAVIPIEKYRRFEREEQEAQTNFFQMVDKMREEVKDISPSVLEETITEAVQAVKKSKSKITA